MLTKRQARRILTAAAQLESAALRLGRCLVNSNGQDEDKPIFDAHEAAMLKMLGLVEKLTIPEKKKKAVLSVSRDEIEKNER